MSRCFKVSAEKKIRIKQMETADAKKAVKKAPSGAKPRKGGAKVSSRRRKGSNELRPRRSWRR